MLENDVLPKLLEGGSGVTAGMVIEYRTNFQEEARLFLKGHRVTITFVTLPTAILRVPAATAMRFLWRCVDEIDGKLLVKYLDAPEQAPLGVLPRVTPSPAVVRELDKCSVFILHQITQSFPDFDIDDRQRAEDDMRMVLRRPVKEVDFAVVVDIIFNSFVVRATRYNHPLRCYFLYLTKNFGDTSGKIKEGNHNWNARCFSFEDIPHFTLFVRQVPLLH